MLELGTLHGRDFQWSSLCLMHISTAAILHAAGGPAETNLKVFFLRCQHNFQHKQFLKTCHHLWFRNCKKSLIFPSRPIDLVRSPGRSACGTHAAKNSWRGGPSREKNTCTENQWETWKNQPCIIHASCVVLVRIKRKKKLPVVETHWFRN